jgi:hypothetical protein
MKNQSKILMLALLVAVLFTGLLNAMDGRTSGRRTRVSGYRCQAL